MGEEAAHLSPERGHGQTLAALQNCKLIEVKPPLKGVALPRESEEGGEGGDDREGATSQVADRVSR